MRVLSFSHLFIITRTLSDLFHYFLYNCLWNRRLILKEGQMSEMHNNENCLEGIDEETHTYPYGKRNYEISEKSHFYGIILQGRIS